jgi:hypothetical protein
MPTLAANHLYSKAHFGNSIIPKSRHGETTNSARALQSFYAAFATDRAPAAGLAKSTPSIQ